MSVLDREKVSSKTRRQCTYLRYDSSGYESLSHERSLLRGVRGLALSICPGRQGDPGALV